MYHSLALQLQVIFVYFLRAPISFYHVLVYIIIPPHLELLHSYQLIQQYFQLGYLLFKIV